MPTGRRGVRTRRPHFPSRFASVKALNRRTRNISHEPDSVTAEIGRSEAKVLGDLLSGISPTAPRFHCWQGLQLLSDDNSLLYRLDLMCGRFTLKSPGRIKFEGVNHAYLPALFPRYNIAPGQNVLAILQPDEGALLHWGLIPSWSNEGKGFINARSETVEDKPSFSESFQRRRCLIPADGFYEWQRSGKMAQPYYFQMQNGSPFAFAGIWDEWRRGVHLRLL